MLDLMICNTLQSLNPNALPLDDIARAEMPKMLNLAHKYRRGLLNRYEFEKALCNIMDYPISFIKGVFVKRSDGDIMDVFDNDSEAAKAIAEYAECDEAIGYKFSYTTERR